MATTEILSVQVDGSGFYLLDVQEADIVSGHLYPTVGSISMGGPAPIIRNGVHITPTPGVIVMGGPAPSIHGTIKLDQFAQIIRHHTTGAALIGLTTVTMTGYQRATGLRLDFSDGTFKSSPVTPTATLSQVSAADQPGLYLLSTQTYGWAGWVEWEITYNDGSYTYSYPYEGYYIAGVRVNGDWSAAQQAAVVAIENGVAAVQSTLGVAGAGLTGIAAVGGIAGTTQTLDALQAALNAAHGAGGWSTATGFATPGAQMDLVNSPNATALAALAVVVEAHMLNDSDGQALLAAIVAKINATDVDLAGLSVSAIASAAAAAILATPANKLVTDGSGNVTAGTVLDKTGYTASTVSDKTGYSLATTPAAATDMATALSDLDALQASVNAIPTSAVGTDAIAAAVWNKQTSDMTTSGSIGAWLLAKVLTLPKFLGLK